MRFPSGSAWVKAIMTTLLPILTAVAITIPVTMGITHSEVASASRASDVNTCIAANRTSGGIEKLIAQIKKQVGASKTLTPAQKAAYESFYAQLRGDFPSLDCTQNPIAFTPPPAPTTVGRSGGGTSP